MASKYKKKAILINHSSIFAYLILQASFLGKSIAYVRQKNFKYLFWRYVALYFHPIVVHKDISLCGRTSGALHLIGQQFPNLCGCPDAEGPFPLFRSPRCWDRVCILCTVEPPRLSHTRQKGEGGRSKTCYQ